ncbi:MAG: hypothetical protein ABH950_02775 [Candidatus Altiarchaeota archaeon]
MARKINKNLYLMAGAITLVVFGLGLLLGMVVESYRISYIQASDREQRINFASLQLQYLYLNALGERERCPAFSATLNDYIKSNDKIRIRLEGYVDDELSHSEDFTFLKRDYLISQLNYWILARKTQEFCDSDFVVVLFFHKKDCPLCEDQGFVLDYFKKMFGDRILIFAFDSEFNEEPMIPVLLKTYSIRDAPTVIVENKTFTGFASKEVLFSEICSRYIAKPPECLGETPADII